MRNEEPEEPDQWSLKAIGEIVDKLLAERRPDAYDAKSRHDTQWIRDIVDEIKPLFPFAPNAAHNRAASEFVFGKERAAFGRINDLLRCIDVTGEVPMFFDDLKDWPVRIVGRNDDGKKSDRRVALRALTIDDGALCVTEGRMFNRERYEFHESAYRGLDKCNKGAATAGLDHIFQYMERLPRLSEEVGYVVDPEADDEDGYDD